MLLPLALALGRALHVIGIGVLELAGIGAIAWGIYLVYPPAVWIWLGAYALGLAYVLELRRAASRDEDAS